MIGSIGSSTSYAAGLARSCYISGLGYMDLPNIYELMVCWCEADNIDNMDPTADDYPDLKIGYTATYGRFMQKSSEIISVHASSEYNAQQSRCISAWGDIARGSKTAGGCSVIPVKEL